MVLIATATSCTPVNTTDVDQDKVDYGVIKQAQEKFENDSITSFVLIQTEDYDYVVNENLVVVSKYDKTHNEAMLIVAVLTFLLGFFIGALIYI